MSRASSSGEPQVCKTSRDLSNFFTTTEQTLNSSSDVILCFSCSAGCSKSALVHQNLELDLKCMKWEQGNGRTGSQRGAELVSGIPVAAERRSAAATRLPAGSSRSELSGGGEDGDPH